MKTVFVLFALFSVLGVRGESPERSLRGSLSVKDFNKDVNIVLQVAFLVDASFSYGNDFINMVAKIPAFFEELGITFADIQVGLASFVDKPHKPLGRSFDHCYALRVPLTSDIVAFEEAYLALPHGSGLDWKEAQLEALYISSMSSLVGWESDDLTPEGQRVVKAIIMPTDSGYHVRGDAAAYFDTAARPPKDTEAFLNCDNTEYPSVAEVGDALRLNGIRPIFVATSDVVGDYEDLVAELDAGGRALELRDDAKDMAAAVRGGLLELCMDVLGISTKKVANE